MVNIRAERGIGFLHVLEFTALALQSDISPDPLQERIDRLVDGTVSIRSEGRECRV